LDIASWQLAVAVAIAVATIAVWRPAIAVERAQVLDPRSDSGALIRRSARAVRQV
jgi:hypothetical protein